MPVPPLESSINRYLTAVKPLLNNWEFENTKKLALNFAQKDGIGEKLQKLLVEKSKSTDNWVLIIKEREKKVKFYFNIKQLLNLKLAQWWLDKIYLEPRYSVVINVSPGTLYPKENYKTLEEQLLFATRYICGFLDFKKFLEE